MPRKSVKRIKVWRLPFEKTVAWSCEYGDVRHTAEFKANDGDRTVFACRAHLIDYAKPETRLELEQAVARAERLVLDQKPAPKGGVGMLQCTPEQVKHLEQALVAAARARSEFLAALLSPNDPRVYEVGSVVARAADLLQVLLAQAQEGRPKEG